MLISSELRIRLEYYLYDDFKILSLTITASISCNGKKVSMEDIDLLMGIKLSEENKQEINGVKLVRKPNR